MKISKYDNFEEYLIDIEYEEVWTSDYELEDLERLRCDFSENGILCEDSLHLLSSYQSGCGGTVMWREIPKEMVGTKIDPEKIFKEDDFHDTDYTDLAYDFVIIGNRCFIEGSLPG